VRTHYIDEPYLEFGRGQELCPRRGITEHDVYDTRLMARRDKILVGAVGTSEALAKLDRWIERCATPIPARLSEKPKLFPAFCGFNSNLGFKSQLILYEETTRPLNNSDIQEIKDIPNWNQRVEAAVELYCQQVEFLARYRVVDVIVCIIPDELFDLIAKGEVPPVEETIDGNQLDDLYEHNCRRALKARTMHLGRPLQLLRELSLDANAPEQQDEATKAWNFCTALYYKANKTVPWKLVTNINRPAVCFAGIGFYRSRDKKALHTSLAQVFDELGNGLILRGGQVDLSKDDRVPHLSAEQAYTLLKRALDEYELALNNSPGRLVLHKSSNYNRDEMDGFQQATKEMRVRTVDYVTILDTNLRLLRDGVYPPYRGTHIELDRSTHLLYTRGSVKYYETYPGKYVPQPLEVRLVETDESADVICAEILGLTKMNWNTTQFDRKYPITIECARKVGQIMKYVDPATEPQVSYSYYM